MSVEGLELFRQRFAPYSDAYVLIGGSACDLLFSEQGMDFRATHDLDIVVLVDKPLSGFAKTLWQFINDGDYLCGWRNNPDVHYYRFTEPKSPGFPRMIELFARHPGFPLRDEASYIVPLPVNDDISSLSAILLDDDYYEFLKSSLSTINGINVPDVAHLIPLKARAHIDLSERKDAGQHVNSTDLKKHKKDVVSLVSIVPVNVHIELSSQMKEDMKRFVGTLRQEGAQSNQTRPGLPLQGALDALEDIYNL
ncbi:MAG: hypothetical protein LBL23_04990 [Coriobacteriales bacterium]|jgi:hypothetical protein|nr:hypothetical protein [Coriobacteriales bacterium]